MTHITDPTTIPRQVWKCQKPLAGDHAAILAYNKNRTQLLNFPNNRAFRRCLGLTKMLKSYVEFSVKGSDIMDPHVVQDQDW